MELVPVSIRGPLGQFFCFYYATFLIIDPKFVHFPSYVLDCPPQMAGMFLSILLLQIFYYPPKAGRILLGGRILQLSLKCYWTGSLCYIAPNGELCNIEASINFIVTNQGGEKFKKEIPPIGHIINFGLVSQKFLIFHMYMYMFRPILPVPNISLIALVIFLTFLHILVIPFLYHFYSYLYFPPQILEYSNMRKSTQLKPVN